jgi:hypothetical protein
MRLNKVGGEVGWNCAGASSSSMLSLKVSRGRQQWCGDMSHSPCHNSNASLHASWPSLSCAPPCTNPCHGAPAYHSTTHALPPRGSHDAPTAHAWAQQPICVRHASLQAQQALLRPCAQWDAGHVRSTHCCCWCWS